MCFLYSSVKRTQLFNRYTRPTRTLPRIKQSTFYGPIDLNNNYASNFIRPIIANGHVKQSANFTLAGAMRQQTVRQEKTALIVPAEQWYIGLQLLQN